MLFFSRVTLKLISNPVLTPANFMLVSNWASWMPLIPSTLFSLMISVSSTSTAIR